MALLGYSVLLYYVKGEILNAAMIYSELVYIAILIFLEPFSFVKETTAIILIEKNSLILKTDIFTYLHKLNY